MLSLDSQVVRILPGSLSSSVHGMSHLISGIVCVGQNCCVRECNFLSPLPLRVASENLDWHCDYGAIAAAYYSMNDPSLRLNGVRGSVPCNIWLDKLKQDR